MMFAPLLLSFFTLAFAAPSPSPKSAWLSGLTDQLTELGLNTLVSVLQTSMDSSSLSGSLGNIDQLQGTLIAPSDAAWTGFNTSDVEQLAATLALHFLAGSHNGSSVAPSPAHTVAHSFLSDSKYSNLPDQLGQAVILSVEDGITQVLNQQGGSQINVVQASKYADLDILVVEEVLTLPFDWEVVLPEIGLQILYQVATDVVEDVAAWLAMPGVTVFAPVDAALKEIVSDVGMIITTNMTLSGVLHNHFINGTTLYSDQFGNGPWVSGGGESFTFNTNATGTWVTMGDVTANITHSDIPFMNGVIHIVDRVLLDSASDPTAAAEGYSANQASASWEAFEATATAAIPTPSPSQSQTPNSNGGSSFSQTSISLALAAAVAAFMAIFL